MKIWHIGASPFAQKVSGVNNLVWLLAREQARQGQQVSVVISGSPDKTAMTWAEETGLKILTIGGSSWRYSSKDIDRLLNLERPDLVHMHSVFLLKQAFLAKSLVRQNIPYVITPNSISPQLLQRGWLKKAIYSFLLEKPRFLSATAITAVTPKEREAIQAFVPSYRGKINVIPNPIDVNNLGRLKWNGEIEAKRVVYLGRFDVLHKGIDILVDMAREVPDIQFHLYGSEDEKTKEWLKELRQSLPDNIYFHSPVFGVEKNEVLASASLYIQMSRWEIFGISIAEAMSLGVPCAIADSLNLAEFFQKHDLGLVMPLNPQEAALALKKAFAEPTRLQEWSTQGKAFALENFQLSVVASKYLEVYEEVTA